MKKMKKIKKYFFLRRDSYHLYIKNSSIEIHAHCDIFHNCYVLSHDLQLHSSFDYPIIQYVKETKKKRIEYLFC